jgi:outer membrane protein TolC
MPVSGKLQRVSRLVWVGCCLTGLLAAQISPPTQPTGSGFGLLDAVRNALSAHPQILTEKQQVEIQKGLLLQQTAAFDTVLQGSFSQSRTYSPLTQLQQLQAFEAGVLANSQLSNSTTINFSASRLFRNGISVSPVVQSSRSADNLTNIPGLGLSHFDVEVDLPLLQGRGRTAVAAQETAADIEVGATLLDVNQTIAQTLATAASSYWALVAAMKSLQVALESEARGRSFVENTQTMVDADQTPRNDLNNVIANLADRTATRIAAEQAVASARQQLALNMGLTADQVLAMGDPSEDFPPGEDQPLLPDDSATLRRYLSESLDRRPDVLAARRRVQEAQTLVAGARNLLRPRLDVTITTGYSGLREGRSLGDYLVSPFRNVGGADIAGGLNFRFPVGNHAATGQLEQAKASEIQAQLRLLDTSRTVSAAIVNAVQNLREAIARLASARQSVESFERALAGERAKFSLGLNSIVDILSIEDRLTSAQSNQVQSKLSYAQAIIAFRYATGTIVAPDRPVQTINRDVFVTVRP